MERASNVLRGQVDRLTIANMKGPECLACDDLGWIDAPGGGMMRCGCENKRQEKARFQGLVSKAGMDGLEGMTFEAYRPVTDRQREALRVMSEGHGSFYLFGPYGVGKTHLVAASVLRACKAGVPSVIISVPRMLDVVRKAGRDSGTDIEALASEIPYLCLDDIGKEKVSDWTEERMFMLADARYRLFKAGKGQTSFTSQLPLAKLAERIDGAIVSRIKGMCREVFVNGEDYRCKR